MPEKREEFQRPNREVEDEGVELERYYLKYLQHWFGKKAVTYQPKDLVIGKKWRTVPDYEIKLRRARRRVYVDVTGSVLRFDNWGNPELAKSEQVKFYEEMSKLDDSKAGLVVYQQHAITPEGLLLTERVIRELATGRISTKEGQAQLNKFALGYKHITYKAGHLDWKQTGINLIEAMEIPTGEEPSLWNRAGLAMRSLLKMRGSGE
jgi:hypothetical protein